VVVGLAVCGEGGEMGVWVSGLWLSLECGWDFVGCGFVFCLLVQLFFVFFVSFVVSVFGFVLAVFGWGGVGGVLVVAVWFCLCFRVGLRVSVGGLVRDFSDI